MSIANRARPDPSGAGAVAPDDDEQAVDLEAVEELCRLALAARRLGCEVTLSAVAPHLRDLLVLAGVDGALLRNSCRHHSGEADLP